MKIIHVVESFAGGVFDFLVELIHGMPDHEFIIIHGIRDDTPENYRRYFPPTTQFITWKGAAREIRPLKDAVSLFQLYRLIKKHKDVGAIHLHSSKAGVIGRIASRIQRRQDVVLYTPHGVSFLRRDVSPLKRKFFVYLEKMGAWFGGKVVACSMSEAEAFHRYGIEAGYINNGIRCDALTDDYKDTKRKEKIRIGTVGRITFQKNPWVFNDIARAFNMESKIEFVWIGDGELRGVLEHPNIEITGWLRGDALKTSLLGIDIYLSTSLWEGLPLSVLQAMCAEKALILANSVGNKDLVKNDYNGVLFNETDEAIAAIVDMIDDPARMRRFGINSRELVRNEFSIDQMIEGYALAYN